MKLPDLIYARLEPAEGQSFVATSPSIEGLITFEETEAVIVGVYKFLKVVEAKYVIKCKQI